MTSMALIHILKLAIMLAKLQVALLKVVMEQRGFEFTEIDASIAASEEFFNEFVSFERGTKNLPKSGTGYVN